MKPITVAAISTENHIGRSDRAIADMSRWVDRACGQGAELVLFPELNVTGHFRSPRVQEVAEPVPGPSTETIVGLAGEAGVVIGFGIIERDGDALHCTHVMVNGSGVIGKQRKIHVPAQEQPFWSPGDAIEVLDLDQARVGIAICRDAFFDEMTRTLYFGGAEIILMPFGYYNVPRTEFLRETIHGMSIVKSSWTNGVYSVVCNSAGDREPSPAEPRGRRFPGWAGVISPWGRVMSFVDAPGNGESMVVERLEPAELEDRRAHPNFLARELRPELYRFRECTAG